MSESGKAKLVSLLFDTEGERELANFKFLPGTDRGLTADRMCDVAAGAIERALAGELVSEPPLTGRDKCSFEDYAQ